MSATSDARFWDRTSRRYARSAVADAAGYERTLERTAALLGADDRVLELGCGTGTTALRLAGGVRRYLATDISAKMIGIAEGRSSASGGGPAPAFRVATAEELATEAERFDAVLGFNYLHLVRDLAGTLRSIHALLAEEGIFVSKTPCLRDMNPLLRWVLLPAMRAVGMAPHVTVFRLEELHAHLEEAGFEIRAVEWHATRGGDDRPFIVARRRRR
ncbi:class I SAM-dependent methyltransferase [Nitratireductor soli]|uniref:class I SAM-dependent methyltransferase n=1 Tax=Nitratireductor soli TaxID=1670619 RepID=UPI00065E633B|nr:class I SAM-dependent methyltransferase [Nitratireductor soli]